MERWNEYILASISFGTEMDFNKEGGIEYTNIPGPIKVCMKVLGYLHHQFTAVCDWYKSWNKR